MKSSMQFRPVLACGIVAYLVTHILSHYRWLVFLTTLYVIHDTLYLQPITNIKLICNAKCFTWRRATHKVASRHMSLHIPFSNLEIWLWCIFLNVTYKVTITSFVHTILLSQNNHIDTKAWNGVINLWG